MERTNRTTQSSRRSSQLRQEYHKEKSQQHPFSLALLKRVTPGGAKITFVERWKWEQELEYLNGLMRPEITQYLVKITAELAKILGIELAEVK